MFFIEKYIRGYESEKRTNTKTSNSLSSQLNDFDELCERVYHEFETDDNSKSEKEITKVERQINAIMGKKKERNYYRERIKNILVKAQLEDHFYPEWHENLISAIFEENWGYACLADYIYKHASYSDATVINGNIFYLIGDKYILQPQKISVKRLERFVKNILIFDKKQRFSSNANEIMLPNDVRVDVFKNKIVQGDGYVLTLRKITVADFSLEVQAEKNTIPDDPEVIGLLKETIKSGFNIAIVGAPGAGKTTFLKALWRYEDTTQQGVCIQDIPEIKPEEILPNTPIIPFIATEEGLKDMEMYIRRSNGAYVVVPEARTGMAYLMALEAASIGTSRCKVSSHVTFVLDFPRDVAEKICDVTRRDFRSTIVKVAKSYHFILELVKLGDQQSRKLASINEFIYDDRTHEISIRPVMLYDFDNNTWSFNDRVGDDKNTIGSRNNKQAFERFKNHLKSLNEKYPMDKVHAEAFVPYYGKLG